VVRANRDAMMEAEGGGVVRANSTVTYGDALMEAEGGGVVRANSTVTYGDALMVVLLRF
jgi:hypothetical protein